MINTKTYESFVIITAFQNTYKSLFPDTDYSEVSSDD